MIREEFGLKEYRGFPDRKLALLDYWLAQIYAIRAELQYEVAVKEEGKPHYAGK